MRANKEKRGVGITDVGEFVPDFEKSLKCTASKADFAEMIQQVQVLGDERFPGSGYQQKAPNEALPTTPEATKEALRTTLEATKEALPTTPEAGKLAPTRPDCLAAWRKNPKTPQHMRGVLLQVEPLIGCTASTADFDTYIQQIQILGDKRFPGSGYYQETNKKAAASVGQCLVA